MFCLRKFSLESIKNVLKFKNFGPILGQININEISKISETDFVEKIFPVYKALKKVSNNQITNNKNIIGFVGAPWTLLVYMINQQSPKKDLKQDFFKFSNNSKFFALVNAYGDKFLSFPLFPNDADVAL